MRYDWVVKYFIHFYYYCQFSNLDLSQYIIIEEMIENNIALGRYVYDAKRFRVSQNNAKTYQGYSKDTGQLVSIKMVRARTKVCTGIKYIDQETQRQLQAFSIFKHSHFVNAVELAEKQNHIYIISERHKDTLEDYMNYLHRPEDAFRMFLDLVISVCVLRSKRYLHRNFVASSIEIGEQNLKLSCLDACVHQQEIIDQKKQKNINGNWREISPEDLVQDLFTQKSLIWNLGVILHRLLFKMHPYQKLTKEDITLMRKTVQVRLNVKTNPYLQGILVGCLNIDPNERFNLNGLLRFLLLNQFIPEHYQCIILNKLKFFQEPMKLLGCLQLLQKYLQMKQVENEINYIRILQRTCYLSRKVEGYQCGPPLFALTKYIIQCRLKKLDKFSYWKKEKVNSIFQKQKQQVEQNQTCNWSMITLYDQFLLKSQQYLVFQDTTYRYRQIVYLHYQAFLRQFILKNVEFLHGINQQTLSAYQYQVYTVDFAISLFSLGQDIITQSQTHRWKFLGEEMSKIAEDPLEFSIVQIFNEIQNKLKHLQIKE